MEREVRAEALRFRWIQAQCYEIRLPNGRYILTDPFISEPVNDNPKLDHWRNIGISWEDVEGADYIILNHLHTDHAVDLARLQKKFDSTVITHSATALEVAKRFNIPFTRIYPVDFGNTCWFPDFRLDVFHGRHAHRNESWDTTFDPYLQDYGMEGFKVVGHLGSIFNMNYVITTNDNVRIGFSAGYADDILKQWENVKPNLLIRHLMFKDNDGGVEDFIRVVKESGALLAIPTHLDAPYKYDNDQVWKWVDETNKALINSGSACRCMHPIRGRWYQLSASIAPLD